MGQCNQWMLILWPPSEQLQIIDWIDSIVLNCSTVNTTTKCSWRIKNTMAKVLFPCLFSISSLLNICYSKIEHSMTMFVPSSPGRDSTQTWTQSRAWTAHFQPTTSSSTNNLHQLHHKQSSLSDANAGSQSGNFQFLVTNRRGNCNQGPQRQGDMQLESSWRSL